MIEDLFYYYRFNKGSLTKSYRENYLSLIKARDEEVRTILSGAHLLEQYEKYVRAKFINISYGFIANALIKSGKAIKNEIKSEIGTYNLE